MYGNAVASPRDIATFYWELLNPANAGLIISAESQRAMTDFHRATTGWRANSTEAFGAGLERIYASEKPEFQNLTMCYGHAGQTYGFQSQNSFCPNLSGGPVTVSVTINSDRPRCPAYDLNYACSILIVCSRPFHILESGG